MEKWYEGKIKVLYKEDALLNLGISEEMDVIETEILKYVAADFSSPIKDIEVSDLKEVMTREEELKKLNALRVRVMKDVFDKVVSSSEVDEEYLKTHEEEIGALLMLEDLVTRGGKNE